MDGIIPPNSTSNQSSRFQQPDDDCSICLETLAGKEVTVTKQCDHMFHKHCLSMWLSDHTSCPLCKVRIVERQVRAVPQVQLPTVQNNRGWFSSFAVRILTAVGLRRETPEPEHQAWVHQLAVAQRRAEFPSPENVEAIIRGEQPALANAGNPDLPENDPSDQRAVNRTLMHVTSAMRQGQGEFPSPEEMIDTFSLF